ncbi:mechanosensitive ion channel [Pseudomonas mediterranea]|jgi:small-conductance mechanosensitive channel|uniref:Small-conductance mechanosensitive channel n=1 Tax=Pseudomonas mediterranea TaxID=183795 RepID=A0AAX2DGA8_9PSED|nr:mechanosensitive ion channel family protein [Pseudomonas mediterranea]MBL0844636.1 mechanosensitive ion channel family protein [Pseudomonas mediterranea]QHA81921.1 mechanosensitive ion channel [Pseudomonas mediterranea]UZE02865.1 mechanosensitive ion channel family protein [Pseudomonas mediterranea]CAH0170694.1 Small-conductance mechanosensitive channel [Pseudomonas mediterranea]SDU69531.1 Small-conductance mechanosensitive channel [Pseudomonas mediterranea]
MDSSSLEFFTDTQLLGISIANWLLALGVMTVSFIVARASIGFLLRNVRARAQKPNAYLSHIAVEVLSSTSNTLLLLASILIGIGVLDLPERWLSRVSSLWFVVAALQMGLWANRAIALALLHYFARHNHTEIHQKSALATLSLWGAKVFLWAMVLLAMLSNLGVNITAFIASLGVGGIAVALAVQNILGDLFASLSIAVDKPFEVGDFIVVGSLAGTVEHVGLKTTRIRSLGGEQIVMANAEMISTTIQNYKRLQERRIVFEFALPLDCSTEQLKQVPVIVERIIKAQEKTRFDRSHFRGIGQSALEFETVYIVLDPSYNIYMDIQQAINLGMMEEFAKIGVRFAIPARTVHVASLPHMPAQPTGESDHEIPTRATPKYQARH